MASPKILIVDDEPYNIDYLEQELEDSNFEIFTAMNGQEALEKVRSQSPDLVLLDVMMPVMDGFEVLSRIKADPATRDIPVIVISASNNLQSVVRGIQLGAEDYLPKPFEPTLLHARISSSVEKKRLRDLEQTYLKGLERELEIGREIQQGFLPSALPKVEGWEIAAYFKAAREVAGDFYDTFLLPDGDLMCVIGDVCGKGVGAALFMTLFRSLIRATATTETFHDRKDTPVFTPAERLQHVVSFTNKYIAETHGDASMFATLFLGIFQAESGKFTYINCGNESPLLFGDGCILAQLGPTGPVVGIFPWASYSVKEITMETEDALLAFTDGITDALNPESASYGRERLAGLIGEGKAAPGVLLRKIEEDLDLFTRKAKQFDDITILAVKRTGAAG
jgi:serine phosphatase RsbU (regulator of sigma subunit)